MFPNFALKMQSYTTANVKPQGRFLHIFENENYLCSIIWEESCFSLLRSAGLTKSGDFCAQIPIDTALSTQQKTLLHITHFAPVCSPPKIWSIWTRFLVSSSFPGWETKSQCATDLVSDSWGVEISFLHLVSSPYYGSRVLWLAVLSEICNSELS